MLYWKDFGGIYTMYLQLWKDNNPATQMHVTWTNLNASGCSSTQIDDSKYTLVCMNKQLSILCHGDVVVL